MAKIKKISVNAFEKAMKEKCTPIVNFEWNGIEVTVKKVLSLKEMLEFVDSVVKSCFTKDNNIYMPEIKDFAIKVCVLEKYANFTMPRNAEAQYALIYNTDAVERVVDYINPQQYNEIRSAISKKIENLAQANVEEINRQADKLYNEFDNLQARLDSVFSGVSNDDIRAVIGTLANGTLDEDRLVKAYTNQSKENPVNSYEFKD